MHGKVLLLAPIKRRSKQKAPCRGLWMRRAGSLWHKRHHSKSSEKSSTTRRTTLLLIDQCSPRPGFCSWHLQQVGICLRPRPEHQGMPWAFCFLHGVFLFHPQRQSRKSSNIFILICFCTFFYTLTLPLSLVCAISMLYHFFNFIELKLKYG